MGWRFRRSKSLFGGLIRLTLGPRGVSTSVGIPGFRVSRSPRGKLRRTVSLPGTGISHFEDVEKWRSRKGR